MPVAANASSVPTFTVVVNGTGPEWFYCGQAKHCQSGMVFAINPTAEKSLAGYKANCANATANIVPTQPNGNSPAPPASAPAPPPGNTGAPAPSSSGTPTGSQTSLPIHTGAASSTMPRTASWAFAGLAGWLTFMML